MIKQVIKQRILADCWKKHPKFGTIPIEIYVMSAISNTSYVLPSRRPWDPSRLRSCPDNTIKSPSDGDAADDWIEGQTVKGHPNICPLLDYFEDSHYYYLVLPSSTPEPSLITPSPPSDLFDLVESFPQGLPSSSIRTYLGQIADALAFLHLHGIGTSSLPCPRLFLTRFSLQSTPRCEGRKCSARPARTVHFNRFRKLRAHKKARLGFVQRNVCASIIHAVSVD